MSFVLAAAMAVSGLLFTGTAAQAASTLHAQARTAGPPFPYDACIKEAKRQGKKDAVARCDNLVKKGWVKPPGR
ncbi:MULTISPECIES: hypothetical protein [Streptomyces]|uniref:Uncharacterized protein n=1 Tax=Streptomyces ramulosus TaxID=47762 RepID=A0ABW1FGH5_9ACTN